MKLDWAETNTGQGIFRCGADTHKNTRYQELIRNSFRLNLLDFVGDATKQNELRSTLGNILDLKATRDKASNDVTRSTDMRDTINYKKFSPKINTAAVYGPNGDIEQYWKDVKSVFDTRTGNGKMILGDFNVTLDFARDTSNYLIDPHKKCRKVINQWIYRREFADVYDELHPGRSSYTLSKSIDKLARERDRNFRTANRDK